MQGGGVKEHIEHEGKDTEGETREGEGAENVGHCKIVVLAENRRNASNEHAE